MSSNNPVDVHAGAASSNLFGPQTDCSLLVSSILKTYYTTSYLASNITNSTCCTSAVSNFINCNPENNIVSLNFSNQNLQGQIPAELSLFSDLKILYLFTKLEIGI